MMTCAGHSMSAYSVISLQNQSCKIRLIFTIKELQGLNHLEGKLEIKKLENVKNSMESKEANLRSKKNLQSLELLWLEGLEEEVQENVIEVIESLQPHSNLRRCFVRGYQGVTFPNWLMTVSAVPKLVEISLEGCRRCVRLPPLGKLPVLKTLKISSMDSVKFIDGEVYGEGEGKGFPSLGSLDLINMPNLEDWSSSVQAATTQQILLPRLEVVSLKDCPKLKGPVPLSSSLRLLQMVRCNETVLGYVRDLPCLSTLWIADFDELVSFPEGALQNLTSLHKLLIEKCEKLKALPAEVERLTTLNTLTIRNCGELISLGVQSATTQQILLPRLKEVRLKDCPKLKGPEPLSSSLEDLYMNRCNEAILGYVRDLPCLSRLCIDEFDELVSFPEGAFQNLTSLHKLQILECKKLKALPAEVERMTTLKTLVIQFCGELISLGERNLSSLETLVILGCPNLKRLPTLNQTCLEELEIFDCPELELSTEEDFEEDLLLASSSNIYISKRAQVERRFSSGVKTRYNASVAKHYGLLVRRRRE